jgi:hypothetical protein
MAMLEAAGASINPLFFRAPAPSRIRSQAGAADDACAVPLDLSCRPWGGFVRWIA